MAELEGAPDYESEGRSSNLFGRATYARARYSNLRAPFVRHASALRPVKIPSCAVLEWSNVLKHVAELGVNSVKRARREGKCHTRHALGDEEALDDPLASD